MNGHSLIEKAHELEALLARKWKRNDQKVCCVCGGRAVVSSGDKYYCSFHANLNREYLEEVSLNGKSK